MALTLPLDSEERKNVPLFSGCFQYAPAALMGVAMHAKRGNDKHNPGQPLHHARWKSMDHADCILRHLMDISDMLAIFERGHSVGGALLAEAVTEGDAKALLEEVDALCWRSLMLSQQVHEQFGGAPLAPRARLGEQREAAPDPGDYLEPQIELIPDPVQPTEMLRASEVVGLACGCVKRCKGHDAQALPADFDGCGEAWIKPIVPLGAKAVCDAHGYVACMVCAHPPAAFDPAD